MSLSLDAVPDGSRILIDTDVWLYLFTGNSPECVRLGARCNEGAIQAYITTIVVGEFCHHAMMLEARQKGILANNNPASFLAKRNSLVRCLGEYRVPVQHWLFAYYWSRHLTSLTLLRQYKIFETLNPYNSTTGTGLSGHARCHDQHTEQVGMVGLHPCAPRLG